MATITAFVRGTNKKESNIRFRISDGRTVQLFYKGSKKISSDIFDTQKQQIKSRALLRNDVRIEINNYILDTKKALLTIYDKYKPTTSKELESLMAHPTESNSESISNEDEFWMVYDKVSQGLSYDRQRGYRCLKNKLLAFSGKTGFVWTFTDTTLNDIKNFEQFLFSLEVSKNYISGTMKKIKVVFNYALRYEYTTNNPFAKYESITPVYGTPYYLTIEERNKIYTTPIKCHYLAVQRDIFVFQCLIGCRVGNLLSLKKSNVVGGFLEYIATKTVNEHPDTIRVPLTDTAKEIIERYKDSTKNDMLLPFISTQKYNDYIKIIFKLCGINRPVTILDPRTRKEKQVPLCDIASSHLARRTFCGNLYKKTKDPNLIGSMSGHAPGSRAFERYRSIDDDIKKETINLIE